MNSNAEIGVEPDSLLFTILMNAARNNEPVRITIAGEQLYFLPTMVTDDPYRGLINFTMREVEKP